MKFLLPLLLLGSILGPTTHTHATTWRSSFECFVNIHHTSLAYGKGVNQVMAHIGVEQQSTTGWMGGSTQTEWSHVQDIQLRLHESGGFLGQAILKGETGKVGPYFKNFVIQYWVTYVDGTTSISPVHPIPVQSNQSVSSWDDYEALRLLLLEDAMQQPVWDSTGCQQIEKISLG